MAKNISADSIYLNNQSTMLDSLQTYQSAPTMHNDRPVFPQAVTYSEDMFERQQDSETEGLLIISSDGKKYSLSEVFFARGHNAIEQLEKPKGFFRNMWDKIKGTFNISNSYKTITKNFIKGTGNIGKFQNVDEAFYKLTGAEYTAENVDKLLKGEIKFNIEIATEKYNGKAIENIPDIAPFVSKYYINKKTLERLETNRTELNKDESLQYEAIQKALSPELQIKLKNALKNGQLLQTENDNNITVLESLHKILTTKRAENLNNLQILEECIEILDNPYIITQKSENIPEEYQEECTKRLVNHEIKKHEERIAKEENIYVLSEQRKEQNAGIFTEEYVRELIIDPIKGDLFNHRALGTCAAASIEYYILNNHPSQFFQMVEELTSEKKSYSKKVKLSENKNTYNEQISRIDSFKVPYVINDDNIAEVTIKADENAYLLAEIQTKYKDEGERSILDIIMQSAIMNLGSGQTYESISDTFGLNIYNSAEGGLIPERADFIMDILTDEHLDLAQYKDLDSDSHWQTVFDTNDIKNEILNTLKDRGSVIVGYCWGNKDSNEVLAHEVTIIGYTTSANGKGFFIIKDTDDIENKPAIMPENELLQMIHHSFVNLENN